LDTGSGANLTPTAILYAAEHPVRDLFAGGGGKALSVAGHYAPRFMDKVLGWWGFDTQKTEKPNRNRRHDGLHEPSGGGNERGDYAGHVAETSLYTKGSMHPLLTGGLLLAGVGLVYAVAKSHERETAINHEPDTERGFRRRKTQARAQPIPTA